MLTRYTYLKNQISGERNIWLADYDNRELALEIYDSRIEDEDKQTVITPFTQLADLKQYLQTEIAKIEQQGFQLMAKQTFIDPECLTVDEIESQILLRYKMAGITDSILFKNARKEAEKIVREREGEITDFDIDAMEFVVALNDQQAIGELLTFQNDNFAQIAENISEYTGISYGYREDGEFEEYEDETYEPDFNSVGIFCRAAAKNPETRELLASYLEQIITYNQDNNPLFKNEETPYGADEAFELALSDKRYLRNYIDFCNSLEESIRFFYARFNPHHGQQILQLLAKHGISDDPLLLEFIASQCVQRDDQHYMMGVAMMAESGLGDKIEEDDEFAQAMFQALLARGRYLSEYYSNGSITGWVARDLAAVIDYLFDQPASQTLLIEIITDEQSCDSIDKFVDLMEDYNETDDDDDDNEDEDDDEEEEGKNFSREDFKQASLAIASFDLERIKAVIDSGIPLNVDKYYIGRGHDNMLLDVYFAALTNPEIILSINKDKVEQVLLLLLQNGVKLDYQAYNTISHVSLIYYFEFDKVITYLVKQGFELNKTYFLHDRLLVDDSLYNPELLTILMNHGADLSNVKRLHNAFLYMPLTLVKRIIEEQKIDLNMLDDKDGLTIPEYVADYCERFVKPQLKEAKKQQQNPKLATKTDNQGHTPAENIAICEERLAINAYLQELAKDLKPLYQPATNPQEQAELDRRLIQACAEREENPDVHLGRMMQPNVVKSLLEVGANPNAQDEQGMTPFHHAISQRYPHLIEQALELLRNAGMKADIVDNFGRTPLFYYCLSYGGSDATFIKVCKFGFDLAHKDHDGKNALAYLLGRWSKDDRHNVEGATQSMVLAGIPVVDIDQDGNSIFHLMTDFTGFDVESIIQQAIKRGADVNGKNSLGQTPLHLAVITESDSFMNTFIRVLCEMGADMNIQDQDGNTPFHMITNKRKVRYLLDEDNPVKADLTVKNHQGISAKEHLISIGYDDF